ncbi:class I SAM-dependent methyltransferase [Candidatus Parcubacteria bacterium]|jgi:SAM-dependent methyltransferase|nr:MAG: class I SAM-dependent methyltransferase [Candidatus Parcubacteria bacterium]
MRDKRGEWNRIAAEYDLKIVRGDFFRKNILDSALLKYFKNIKNRSVLDLGCGQGYFSEILSTLGAHVTGIDISENLIAIAKKNKNINFFIGDIEDALPFEDNSFDIVVSNMVFMDLENPERAIKEVIRVLKKNGLFIVSILHPIFTSGSIYKSIKDKICLQDPSFLLKKYKSKKKIGWNILDTTHTTTVFHRPIEYYINLFSSHNIFISNIEECVLPETFNENGFYRTLHHTPMFLIIEGIINK